MAVQVVDRLEYDFADATRGARLHAVRVATFDAAARRFLISDPSGTVVALGEGLETQFWRVDNGRVRSMTDQRVHIGGQPGCVRRTPDGEIFSVFSLDVVDGRIKTIWVMRNPDKLAHL